MSDNTPDFDSMSPEELMAWMESLAKRQGADEGFTTSADMEIAEIDPDSVTDDTPGYIPYGMDEEKWKAKLAEEERRKAERRASQQPPDVSRPIPTAAAPPEPAAPEPVAPEPEPAPAAQPAAAAAQPDFDAMSPEELMAWMESLAKRQGADEGFTTSADVAIAEIDPDSVEDTTPGYIPYGMDEEKWKAKLAEEERRKAEKRAAQQPTAAASTAQPTAQPVKSTPAPAPQPEPEPQIAPEPEPEPAVAASSQLDLFDEDEEEAVGDTTAATPAAENAMSWLENLAGNTGDDFGIDLSGLSEAVSSTAPEAASGDDPMAWLESLSGGGEAPDLSDLEQMIAPPSGGASEDTGLAWLESLAKNRGVDEDELITDADIEIPPTASTANIEGPGYKAFSFDEAAAEKETFEKPDLSFLNLESESDADIDLDLDELEDPNDWLAGIASGQLSKDAPPPFDDEDDSVPQESEADILEKLQKGKDVSPDEMEDWMANLLDKGAQRSDVPDYIDEDEDEETLVEAELPEWLVNQVGAPPPADAPAAPKPATAPLVDNIIEPPDVEMPDWLKADILEDGDEQLDISAIFDDEVEAGDDLADIFGAATEATEEPTGESITSQLEAIAEEELDPWVEAFEEERLMNDEMPEWYREKLSALQEGEMLDEDAVAAVTASAAPVPATPSSSAAPIAAISLNDAPLPSENEVKEGVFQPVPSWLDASAAAPVMTMSAPVTPAPATPAAEPAADDAEMPEFIFDDAAIDDTEMPDWLREEFGEQFGGDVEFGDGAEGADLPDWLADQSIEVEDVPDWLRDTLGTEEAEAVNEPAAPIPAAPAAPTPAPTPTPQAPRPAPVSPAPVPQVAAATNILQALNDAREKVKAGDVNAGLEAYESVIRANQELGTVTQDLNALVSHETHKKNPAVYRVLGDSLMRQGQLQAALDTYRKALNML